MALVRIYVTVGVFLQFQLNSLADRHYLHPRADQIVCPKAQSLSVSPIVRKVTLSSSGRCVSTKTGDQTL